MILTRNVITEEQKLACLQGQMPSEVVMSCWYEVIFLIIA